MAMTRLGSLLLLASSFLPFAHSCGVLTHNQIVQRASHLFSLPNSLPQFHSPQQIISPLLISANNAAWIQAGAFFPDWGYQCFSTDDESEAAHWPPFLIAAVEHITSKYGFLNDTASASRPKPEQRHLESLVAFIFAVAGHQTSDATWHAIRLPTGLMAALAAVDFHGDVASAHNALDVGGEFLAAARLARLPKESRAWIESSWTVPVDDLVAIYERIGRPVNKLVMRYCCMRGLAALKSGLALGKTLFEQYAAESPMLLEEIDGYYLGGMDEMTARTVNCWANLTRWFSDGIDAGDKLRGGWNICDVFQAIRARGGADRHGGGQNGAKLEDWTDPAYHWSSDYHHHGIDQVHWRSTLAGVKEVDVITNDFGAETYILRKGIPKFEVAPPQVASASRALGFSDPIYVATYVPYGHLGASVSAGYFHTDPNELAFAVGAPWESEDSSRPGEGNVYIIPNSFISQEQTFFQPTGLKNYTRESGSSADPSARHSPDQRFGTASTSLKTLNRTFLAVSAPGPLTYDSGSSPSLPFHEKALAGRVDLFVPGQAKPEFTFSMRGAELGSLGRRQWGDAVTSAALDPESEDEFLVVSGSRTDGERICNGRQKHQYGEGEVTVLRLRPLPQNSKLPRTVEDPFLIVDQTRANCTATGSWGHIASCNPWENGAAAAAGVYTEAFQLLLPESEKQAIDCDDQNTYARYGAATAFSKSAKILWVSAPGLGKVYGYRMAPGQPGMQLVVVIKDEDFLQRLRRTGFGHALATGVWDGQEWVAVAAPNEDAEKARQVGMVRIYRILNNGGEAKLWAEVVPATPMPFTKFGRSLAVDDAEGVLWVGSEFAAEERGAVWEVRIGRLPLREERGCVWWCTKVARKVMIEAGLVGKEVGERFAASLEVGVGGDLVVGVPWAGVGRAKQGERFFGALAVFRRGAAGGAGVEL